MIRDATILRIIIQPDGKFNFQVEGEVMYLSKEEMNDFRASIMEAVGVAEEMWNKQKPLVFSKNN